MRRRLLLLMPGGLLAAGLWPRTGTAQSAPTVVTIGRLHSGSAADPALQASLQAFRDGMGALGHLEGRTYRISARYGEGDAARLTPMATELVRDKVDLIVAAGYAAIRAAKEATRTIPIVMAMAGPDPVGGGLIASLARPGANVTGFSGQTDEVQPKQLELLREIVPGLTDVLVLYNPESYKPPDPTLAAASAALGLRLHLGPVARPEDLTSAFARTTSPGTWAAIAFPDPAVIDRIRGPIAALAQKHRVPSAHGFRSGADAGGLLSFGIDLIDMHRRAAVYVDKILKGARPADLPVERPVKFELIVNLKTARTMGLTIPPSVLVRADEVIE